jgi:hypothetical protein
MFRLFLRRRLSIRHEKLTGFLSVETRRVASDRAIAPLARLVRWAVADPLVAADSPHAYEYMIIADAAEIPPR